MHAKLQRPRPPGLWVLLLVLLFTTSACQAKDATPSDFPATLLGTWQVSEVLLNPSDPLEKKRLYKYNIHKYLGRVFTFTPQRLTGGNICEAPKIVVHRTTAFKAVSQNLCSWKADLETRSTPKDFGLPLANDTPVEVLSPLCQDGLYAKTMGGCHYGEPPPDEIKGAWFIVLNPQRLALRWHDEVFLILQRLPANAQPLASFDCAQAATLTEKAICSSVALASYDVSVAETYKHALAYYQFALKTYDARIRQQTIDQLAAFKQSQKTWLKKRDACGADPDCLEKALSKRIGDMEYEINFYAYDNRAYANR